MVENASLRCDRKRSEEERSGAVASTKEREEEE